MHKHNARAHIPWISINWDTWLVKENAHGVLGNTVADYVMAPEEGTETFVRAVSSGVGQLVVSTGDLEARLNQWVRRESMKSLARLRWSDSSSDTARPSLSTPFVPPAANTNRKL